VVTTIFGASVADPVVWRGDSIDPARSIFFGSGGTRLGFYFIPRRRLLHQACAAAAPPCDASSGGVW